MAYQTNIQWMHGGRILAECGPMRLTISAWVGRVPQKDLCIQAAKESFHLLETIAGHRQDLSRRYESIPQDLKDFPVRKMVRSALAVDLDLTPMAAVAGTIADCVLVFLVKRGMTKAIVNNGGDVALRTGTEVNVHVGLRPEATRTGLTSTMTLGDERPVWGVATSGLEGRSLSRGVASAATVIAGSASIADAAATAIANASYVQDTSVVQRPAGELDAQSDIPDTLVTVQAGPLSEATKDQALAQAMAKAESLIHRGLIFGACVVVDGKAAMTDFVRQRLVEKQ